MSDTATTPPPCLGLARIQVRQDDHRSQWLEFRSPERILRVEELGDVLPALQDMEAEATRGAYVVGCLSYEASPAFDHACSVRPDGEFPLAWFGVYRSARKIPPPEHPGTSAHLHWEPDTRPEDYEAAIASIRAWIAGGDTYQVNYTTRLHAHAQVDPSRLFADLLTYQPRGYAAYLDLGDHVLCSLSPELFFSLDQDHITCRPMKGTAPRGVTNAQDEERAETLRTCEKNRAENVMIVDMIRNDLGRIAIPGSVQVERLYDIERYRTVLQMTSTVTARTQASVPELFKALFPCSSITGAPKVRTMEIIRDLETSPRGIYTGCIGLLQPGRVAQFNVAIRTIQVNRTAGRATYGTGGGIVWDSTASDEYRECLTKALVLRPPPPHLQLLETLRWEPASGYWFFDEHLDRIMDSARYFDCPAERERLAEALATQAALLPPIPHRVRLLVGEDGSVQIDAASLPDTPFCDHPEENPDEWAVVQALEPVDPGNRFLYHKTTRREIYDRARTAGPEARDVLLWNTRGELTESCIANVVARMQGRWLTPPISSGLLGGTYRRHLLEAGRIDEEVIPVAGIRDFDALYLINSVRGWIRATLG